MKKINHTTHKAIDKVIREHDVITLTAKETANFASVLLNLTEPNSALKKAAKRYQDFISTE